MVRHTRTWGPNRNPPVRDTFGGASVPPEGALDGSVCRACSTTGGCKSPAQPDGGEVRANRKGVAARRGLKEAGNHSRGLMDKNRIEAFVAGRAGAGPRSPPPPGDAGPSRAAGVDSAGVRRRRSNLPREVSDVPWSKAAAAGIVARRTDRVGEVSRGHSSPRGRMKARTEGVVSRTRVS